MADYDSVQMTEVNASRLVPQGSFGVRTQVYFGNITLNSQAKSKTISMLKLPKGVKVLRGYICTDTSLGSATISVGISGSAAKYRADAAFTTTDTPTLLLSPAPQTALTAEEEILVTNSATAALPASGNLSVWFEVIPAG